MSGTTIYYIVQRYGKNVDLTVMPHGLRHAAISEGLKLANTDYQIKAKFSRHPDPKILKHHVDNLEKWQRYWQRQFKNLKKRKIPNDRYYSSK